MVGQLLDRQDCETDQVPKFMQISYISWPLLNTLCWILTQC